MTSVKSVYAGTYIDGADHDHVITSYVNDFSAFTMLWRRDHTSGSY